MIAAIRGIVGATLGFFITLYFGVKAFSLGTYSLWRHPEKVNPASRLMGAWAQTLLDVCYGPIMGLTVNIDPIPSPHPDEVTIIYANHPAFEILPLLCLVATQFPGQIKIVARRNIVNGGLGMLVGKAAVAAGVLLLMDRDGGSAIDDLKREAQGVKPGTVLVIFPDGHRPSEKRVTKEHYKWGAEYPEIREWQTCIPRSGGLLKLVEGFDRRGIPVQLVEAMSFFDRKMSGGAEIRKFPGATLTFAIREFDGAAFPRNEKEAQAWLRARWQQLHERAKEAQAATRQRVPLAA